MMKSPNRYLIGLMTFVMIFSLIAVPAQVNAVMGGPLEISVPNSSYVVGDTFTAQVKVSNVTFSASQITVYYNPAVLQVVNSSGTPTTTVSQGLISNTAHMTGGGGAEDWAFSNRTIDNTKGLVDVGIYEDPSVATEYVVTTAEDYIGIRFKVIGNGNPNIHYATAASPQYTPANPNGYIFALNGVEAPMNLVTPTISIGSSAKAITSFSFASPAATGTIDETAHTIAVTVPFSTNVTALAPTIGISPQATINPASGAVQDFTNPVTYTVTAEDSSTQNYVVTVSKAPGSSAKAITSFSFASPAATGTIDETAHTIAVTVPFSTNVTALTPTIGISPQATINPASGAVQDFTNPVTYTVTAEDSTTQNYIVTVSKAPGSSAKAITSFSFASPAVTGTINETAHTIAVTVPFGTNVTALAPTIGISPLATINPASGAAQDFTNPVTYTVTAEDSTTQNYIVTVTVTPGSSAKAITAFSFASPAVTGTIDETAHTIAVTVPFGTNVTALVPTVIISPLATVNPASGAAQDFTNPVTYTVTAQDSTTQAYVVTVNITPPSTNNNLSALVLRSGTTVISLDPQFAAVTTAYAVSVGNAINTVTVTPTAADATASVVVNGTPVTSGTASGNINLSNTGATANTISIAVTAQDSSIKTYTIQVKRAILAEPGALDIVTVDPAIPVTINAEQGAELDVDETQPLPFIEVNTDDATLGTIQVSIPAGTTVSGPAGWSGEINLPTVQSNNSVVINGAQSVSAVIEVGAGDDQLTFDHAVRIVIPGVSSKSVGFLRAGTFTEITRVITADNQATADAQLAAGQDGYINVGLDKVIWTKHFTTFVAYTKASGGGGGGGGGGGSTFTGTLVNDSQGGTVGSGSIGAELQFPAGAMGANFKVKVEATSSTGLNLPANSTIIGSVVEITKDVAGNFKKAITVTLKFDKSKVDLSKVTLSLYFYDTKTSKWVELKNVKVDAEKGTVSGEVDHFTKFAILATSKDLPPVTPPVQNNLTDISGHWAAASITQLVNSGAISGYPDNTFRPDASITRAEFASILVKAFKLAPKDGKVFADTAAHWAKDSIATAQAYGIINGYSDSKFGPDDQITREQMAVMIVKAAQLTAAASDKNFSDKAKIASWAQEAVNTAVAKAIITGYPDNTFRPQGATTRAEAATVIINALK